MDICSGEDIAKSGPSISGCVRAESKSYFSYLEIERLDYRLQLNTCVDISLIRGRRSDLLCPRPRASLDWSASSGENSALKGNMRHETQTSYSSNINIV